jgi:hypothetical protein
MMTRQQRYQIRQRKARKCITCGDVLDPNSIIRCTDHLTKRRIQQRIYQEQLRPKKRRRRRRKAA